MNDMSHADTVQQLRVDLACALRWAARMGLNEGVDNHFSAAVPEPDGTIKGDKFLINPFGWHWSEITASSLVLCDVDGTVLEGSETVEATAFCIHSRIHINHPNAAVVLHTHQPYATALTLLEGGRLEMVEQNALMFDDRIAYDDDYEGLALATEEGDRMAAQMDGKPILMLASHGVMVTGPTVADAFNDLYYLERACMFQIHAKSTGGTLRRIGDNVRARVMGQMETERKAVADRHFTALRRMLDREEPGYRR
ncbi:MAG: aldolase [Thalassobaculum sp.]